MKEIAPDVDGSCKYTEYAAWTADNGRSSSLGVGLGANNYSP